MKVQSFTYNALQENTYCIYDESGKAAIIDPGCYEPSEQNELKDFISSNALKVTHLLNTHCHIDHVLGNYFIAHTFKVPLQIHPLDLDTLRAVRAYAPVYGFQQYQEQLPESYFNEGEQIKVGNTILDILHIPGHAPGHVIFINHAEKIIIGGDVLFKRSIGRTDLPGGNHQALIGAIRNKLFKLGTDYVVYPGHGPSTTVGEEMQLNPFLA